MRDVYIEPEEYKSLDGNKALYVGAIEEWFDIDLLNYSADNCPQTKFIIIGNDKNGILRNISRKNIIYLGPRYFTAIPDYMYFCDYGIIPFKSAEVVETVNPIKMYEFFSLGKPVVSTSWKELELISPPCLLAKDNQEFVDIIRCEKTIQTYDKDQLTDYAKQNTWNKRYVFIKKIIKEYGV